jgi:hypothetical protein
VTLAVASIVAGYLSLLWLFGWPALLAVAAHVGIMLLALWRR